MSKLRSKLVSFDSILGDLFSVKYTEGGVNKSLTVKRVGKTINYVYIGHDKLPGKVIGDLKRLKSIYVTEVPLSDKALLHIES